MNINFSEKAADIVEEINLLRGEGTRQQVLELVINSLSAAYLNGYEEGKVDATTDRR